MMKFVLISIAVILVGLGIYTYSNQSTEKSHSAPTTISQKKEAEEVVQKVEKSLAVTPEVTKQKSSAKNITVKSPKIVSKEPTQEMANEEEIGKGLTLEGIQAMDVSDEEKERLLDDLVYRQGIERPYEAPPSEKEILKMIEEDEKN